MNRYIILIWSNPDLSDVEIYSANHDEHEVQPSIYYTYTHALDVALGLDADNMFYMITEVK